MPLLVDYFPKYGSVISHLVIIERYVMHVIHSGPEYFGSGYFSPHCIHWFILSSTPQSSSSSLSSSLTAFLPLAMVGAAAAAPADTIPCSTRNPSKSDAQASSPKSSQRRMKLPITSPPVIYSVKITVERIAKYFFLYSYL